MLIMIVCMLKCLESWLIKLGLVNVGELIEILFALKVNNCLVLVIVLILLVM